MVQCIDNQLGAKSSDNSGSGAIDTLLTAFDNAVVKFGRDDTMAAAIAIIMSHALQWRAADAYGNILHANANLLERHSSAVNRLSAPGGVEAPNDYNQPHYASCAEI